MKKIIFSFVLILISNCIYSQSFVVKNEKDNSTIPYVNVFSTSKDIGYTTDKKGKVKVDKSKLAENDTLVFSAVGFDSKSIVIKDIINKTVLLTAQPFEKNNDVKLQTKVKTINFIEDLIPAKSIDISFENLPNILTIHFPYEDKYKETPFLKNIKINTIGNENIEFNIRFYDVDENGLPGNFLYNENILVKSKKSRSTITVDLTDFNIKFSEKGVFVGLESLITKENKHYRNVIMGYDAENNAIKRKLEKYAPAISLVHNNSNFEHYLYDLGKWKKLSENNPNTFAIELNLTN